MQKFVEIKTIGSMPTILNVRRILQVQPAQFDELEGTYVTLNEGTIIWTQLSMQEWREICGIGMEEINES